MVLHAFREGALPRLTFSSRFHGPVLMAGDSQGALHLFDEAGNERNARCATAGIQDIAPAGDGVYVACRQRQLRYLPLLDDE